MRRRIGSAARTARQRMRPAARRRVRANGEDHEAELDQRGHRRVDERKNAHDESDTAAGLGTRTGGATGAVPLKTGSGSSGSSRSTMSSADSSPGASRQPDPFGPRQKPCGGRWTGPDTRMRQRQSPLLLAGGRLRPSLPVSDGILSELRARGAGARVDGVTAEGRRSLRSLIRGGKGCTLAVAQRAKPTPTSTVMGWSAIAGGGRGRARNRVAHPKALPACGSVHRSFDRCCGCRT